MAGVEGTEILTEKEDSPESVAAAQEEGWVGRRVTVPPTFSLTASFETLSIQATFLWVNFHTLMPILVALFSSRGLLSHEYGATSCEHP